MHSIYSDPLPPEWDEKPLGTLVTTKRGQTWSKEQERDVPGTGTVPVVRIPNIQERLDLSDLLHLDGIGVEQRSQSAVTRGWTLMVGSNGNPKRIGDSVLIDQDREMVFASFLLGLRPKADEARLTDEFFASWLKLHRVHEFISETSQMTTGLANISWSACRKLPVRFPKSPTEQARIAAVVTAADDHIRALDEQIRRAKRFCIALDQHHFGGEALHARFPYEFGTERTIPTAWCSDKLGLLSQITSGITLNQDREAADNGVRYLTVVNVYRGCIDLTAVRNLELRGDEANTKILREGDILVVEGHANPAEIGRAARVSSCEAGMSFQNHLFRVRVNDENQIRSQFLVRALNSERVRRNWVAVSKTSSGLSTLNRTTLRRLVVPLPKPDVQDLVVAELDEAENLVAALEGQLHAARRVKQSLLQNLLTGRIRLKP